MATDEFADIIIDGAGNDLIFLPVHCLAYSFVYHVVFVYGPRIAPQLYEGPAFPKHAQRVHPGRCVCYHGLYLVIPW